MTNQPPIKVNLSFMEQVLIATTAMGVVVIILTVAFSWSILPDSVPLRFTESTKPDSSWVSKNVLLFICLAVTLFFFKGVETVNQPASHFKYPCPVTEQNAKALYRIARSEICWCNMQVMWSLVFLVQAQIRIALGEGSGMYFILLLMSALIIFATLAFHSHLLRRAC